MTSDRKISPKSIMKIIRRGRGARQRHEGGRNGKKADRHQVLGEVCHALRDHDGSSRGAILVIGNLPPIPEKENESSGCSSAMGSTTEDDDDNYDADSEQWASSGGSPSRRDGASPLVVREASSQQHLGGRLCLPGEELLWRFAPKARARSPQRNDIRYFVKNHIMINNERTRRTRAPLRRDLLLDEAARKHAKRMAVTGRLACPGLDGLPSDADRLGANVGKGPDVDTIHKAMMRTEPDRNNIIDRQFVSMGVGTATGAYGLVYLCQLFSG